MCEGEAPAELRQSIACVRSSAIGDTAAAAQLHQTLIRWQTPFHADAITQRSAVSSHRVIFTQDIWAMRCVAAVGHKSRDACGLVEQSLGGIGDQKSSYICTALRGFEGRAPLHHPEPRPEAS